MTLIRLTKGGVTINEVEEMYLDDFYEWLDAATELQADINKAMRAK
ncbi:MULTISPECIES: hypothetical protein [unclassified Bradyrhizobium]|nr:MULTISPECIES: hypothetical protein [unclassified Bradyrhizobium]